MCTASLQDDVTAHYDNNQQMCQVMLSSTHCDISLHVRNLLMTRIVLIRDYYTITLADSAISQAAHHGPISFISISLCWTWQQSGPHSFSWGVVLCLHADRADGQNPEALSIALFLYNWSHSIVR